MKISAYMLALFLTEWSLFKRYQVLYDWISYDLNVLGRAWQPPSARS